MEAKEMKIGEIRDILTPEGEKIKIQCVRQPWCYGCYAFSPKISCDVMHRMSGQCSHIHRSDHTPSIFKEYIDNTINPNDQFLSQHEVKPKEMNMQKITDLSEDLKSLASISFRCPGGAMPMIPAKQYLFIIKNENLMKELNEAIKPVIEKHIKNVSNLLEKETTSDN